MNGVCGGGEGGEDSYSCRASVRRERSIGDTGGKYRDSLVNRGSRGGRAVGGSAHLNGKVPPEGSRLVKHPATRQGRAQPPV